MLVIMRLWFDTNAMIDENVYSLRCLGTLRDIAALDVELREGMPVTLYMEDGDERGNPTVLLVDAIVEEREKWGLVARVDPTTWRNESIVSESK
jgi:hypothetical protein